MAGPLCTGTLTIHNATPPITIHDSIVTGLIQARRLRCFAPPECIFVIGDDNRTVLELHGERVRHATGADLDNLARSQVVHHVTALNDGSVACDGSRMIIECMTPLLHDMEEQRIYVTCPSISASTHVQATVQCRDALSVRIIHVGSGSLTLAMAPPAGVVVSAGEPRKLHCCFT